MISLTRLFNEELKKLRERIQYLENENKFLMSKLTKKEKKDASKRL
jgi:hypothetical protein